MTYFPLHQTTCFFIPLVAPCKPLLIKEEQYNQEHGVYTAYGICGYELAQNVMRETIYLPDVFLSKTVAERFVALCNELELSLVHLYDAVQDALCWETESSGP